MKSNIFIPKKINVGFQKRSDTYTQKLAYVIYFDQKDVLRKEASWNSWRDKSIDNIIHENVPTSGFVLNKKVGDYSSDWNHRQAYVRVYDPRGFEFEITIENLLYILENASSIKGKGLEGDFIYGWDGKDLILIPTESPDYVEISKFNEIIHANNCIKTKDLKLGATYKTKTNEKWIYMGRFDYWVNKSERVQRKSNSYSGYSYDYIYKDVNKGKYHFFFQDNKDYQDNPYISTLMLKSLSEKFIEVVSEECVENYADLFDKLECRKEYSPYDTTKDEYVSYTFEEFYERVNKERYGNISCYSNKEKYEIKRRYDYTNKCYIDNKCYYEIPSKGYGYKRETIEGTYEEIYNKLQPMYKNEYLQNGKLYKEGK